MSEQSSQQRIEELEVRFTHLEDTVQQLSAELALQQQTLERQLERYRSLVATLSSAPEGASASAIEVPPHY
jgi:uncharacterized coiled-coil protein SlyX